MHLALGQVDEMLKHIIPLTCLALLGVGPYTLTIRAQVIPGTENPQTSEQQLTFSEAIQNARGESLNFPVWDGFVAQIA
jgi:hypothetical protein